MPRIKLNLADMRSSLAYIDIASGRLLQKFEPESTLHQLSIRHIDISPENHVAIAMQYEGQPYHLPPLIAVQQGHSPMQMLTAPTSIQRRLRNYCGSVTFSSGGEIFAVTSPRGGLATYWSATGKYLGMHEQADVCGISNITDRKQEFFTSDGSGRIFHTKASSFAKCHHVFNHSRWDNHMLTLNS